MLLELTSQETIEEATTLEALEALRPEWNDLWARGSRATPFQSPEWLIPWCRNLGKGEPRFLGVRSAERLVALAPFYLVPANGCQTDRSLVIAGHGISGYEDILVEDGTDATLLIRLLEHSRQQSEWIQADFHQIPRESLLLEAEFPSNWSCDVGVHDVSPVLPLPERAEAISRHVPSHMLEKVKYYERRVQRLGEVAFVRADEDNFEPIFADFLRLHTARWSERGLPGGLSTAAVVQFHREAALEMLRIDMLRLYALQIGGRTVAALYAFSTRRKTFFYLSGFDSAFAEVSPGSLIIACAIREAIREGHEEFDFLKGRETYKYMWGAKGRINCRRTCRPVDEPPEAPMAEEIL